MSANNAVLRLPGVLAPPDTQSQLREVRRKNKLLVEQARTRRLERSNRLLESLSYDWVSGYSDIIDRFRNNEPDVMGPAAIWQRRYGKNYPLYQNETELSLLRAPARILCSTNSYGIGMLEGLTSYVIGNGYSYRWVEQDDSVPEELAEAVQAITDEFIERNEWYGGELPGFEEEYFWRTCEDGESIAVTTCRQDGLTDLRIAEPEQLTQPPGGDFREWGFGVRTDPDDAQMPLGYWLTFSDTPMDGEEYTTDEVTHVRRNVKRGMKRGVTDFCFDAHDTLQLSANLRVNLTDGAAQQASIVGVRQHAVGGREEIESFIDEQADYQRVDPLTRKTENYRRYKKGNWEDIPAGMQYVAPPNATNGPVHLQILQASLRAAGVRWNAPEWLPSGDSSNNNYASSLTAESPFVRTVIRRQRGYKGAYARIQKTAIRNYCRRHGGVWAKGRLWSWQEIQKLLELVVEAPSPETRNKLEEAQRNQVEITTGYKSRQQAADEQGYDWERVQRENEEYLQSTGGDGQQLPLPSDGQQQPKATGDPQPDSPLAGQPNELRGTVGGLQAITSLQQQFYAGSIPREAAVSSMQILFGFNAPEAEALFPDVKATKLADDGQGGGDQQPPPDMGGDDDSPPSLDDTVPPLTGVSESLMESFLLEAFTGMITDKAGRKRYYVNGKPVKKEVHDQHAASSNGEEQPPTPPPVAKAAKAKKEPKPKAAPKPKLTAAEKRTAAREAVKTEVKGYIENPSSFSPEKVATMADNLNKLTVVELKAMHKELSGSVPKSKVAQIASIAAHLADRAAKSGTTPTVPPTTPVDKPTEQPTAKAPTQPELMDAVTQHAEKLLSGKHASNQIVPIHELRDEIRKQFGDKAASPEVLNEAILQLWRDKKIDLDPITDPSRVTPDNMRDSIPGKGNHTLFYVSKPWDHEKGRPGDQFGPPAPKAIPKEGEPGFSGTDSLGRKWVDGKLVAAKEKPAEQPTAKPKKEPREAESATGERSAVGQFYDRAGAGEVPKADLDKAIGSLDDMSKADLAKVAKEIEFKHTPSISATELRKQLSTRITARWGANVRSQMAEPQKSTGGQSSSVAPDFTGTVRDEHGDERHYQDGREIDTPPKADDTPKEEPKPEPKPEPKAKGDPTKEPVEGHDPESPVSRNNPRPADKASMQHFADAFQDSMSLLKLFEENKRDGIVKTADVYSEMKKALPGLTPEQFRGGLEHLGQNGHAELKVWNEAAHDANSADHDLIPVRDGGAMGYVMSGKNSDSATLPNAEKPLSDQQSKLPSLADNLKGYKQPTKTTGGIAPKQRTWTPSEADSHLDRVEAMTHDDLKKEAKSLGLDDTGSPGMVRDRIGNHIGANTKGGKQTPATPDDASSKSKRKWTPNQAADHIDSLETMSHANIKKEAKSLGLDDSGSHAAIYSRIADHIEKNTGATKKVDPEAGNANWHLPKPPGKPAGFEELKTRLAAHEAKHPSHADTESGAKEFDQLMSDIEHNAPKLKDKEIMGLLGVLGYSSTPHGGREGKIAALLTYAKGRVGTYRRSQV